MPSIPRSLLIIKSIIIRHPSGTGNRQHTCFRIDRPSDIDFIAYSSTTAVIHCRLRLLTHQTHPTEKQEEDHHPWGYMSQRLHLSLVLCPFSVAPSSLFLGVEKCLDLALRTAGVAGSVTPTRTGVRSLVVRLFNQIRQVPEDLSGDDIHKSCALGVVAEAFALVHNHACQLLARSNLNQTYLAVDDGAAR